MVKELDEARKKFLMDEGDSVYLQGNAKKIRSKRSYVEATPYTDPDAIDLLLSWHGKILTMDELKEIGANGGNEGDEAIKFECGTYGMVLSQFWYEYPKKKDPEGADPEEGEEPEMGYAIYCFLMVEDHMILVSHRDCTKVHS